MDWQSVGQLSLDTLLDSLKVLAFAFAIYLLLSFFEEKIAKLLEKNKKWGPAFGSLFGAIPQCGISVVGADLYLHKHITMGTIIAIFIACSDEALPIFFSAWDSKWWAIFPVLGIKMALALLVGLGVDLLISKAHKKEVDEHLESCHGNPGHHVGCCGHEIEGEEENPWKEHLLHPLLHSLKIFLYAYVISFLFGLLILGIGEEKVFAFLGSNRYLSPLFAVIVGAIPNCASSVILSEIYLSGGLPFGALLAGLSFNAGLGPLYLFKNKTEWKKSLLVMGICLLASLAIGYGLIWL